MVQVGEISRSIPYPVLEDGNLSYPEGQYHVSIVTEGNVSVVVNHQLQGAPFIVRLLGEGKCKFGCLVSVPLTGYRKLELSKDSRQVVEWDIDVIGEPPMLRPIVVAVEEFTCKLDLNDGVNEAWRDRSITFPKGARLALRGYLKAFSSLNQLLEVVKDVNLPSGSFEVQPCTEEGFYFKVKVATDLFGFIQDHGGYQQHRGSILSHVASRCFEILKQNYGPSHDVNDDEGDWRQFRNLLALSEYLEQNDLNIWDEDEFSPELVATRLYPHKLPELDSD